MRQVDNNHEGPYELVHSDRPPSALPPSIFPRRFQALQSSGDAMVAAMLEALIADVSLFPKASSERIGLYQLFTRLFTNVSIKVPVDSSSPNWEKQAQANLGALAPLERQAFLLVAVEGFSEDEAAEILEMSIEEFAELLTQASAEVSRQMATDILIIEDEPLIAMDIEEMVESLGHRVVGVARTHTEATEMFRKARPRMVLADIQLADGSSGIDAVNEILALARNPRDLHRRLSGTVVDRQAPRTDLPRDEAVRTPRWSRR